jgi:hypothetical protein
MGFCRRDDLGLPAQSHSIYINGESTQQHDSGDCICVCVWLLFPWCVERAILLCAWKKAILYLN